MHDTKSLFLSLLIISELKLVHSPLFLCSFKCTDRSDMMIRFGLSRFPHLALSMTSSSGILSKKFLKSQQQIVNFCACTANTSRCSMTQFSFGNTKKNYLREPHTGAFARKHYESVSPGRSFSSSSEESKRTEGEANLTTIIRKCFPNATNIAVEDISGKM